MSNQPFQTGVIGLAVMGANLARNFASHGIRTAVFNRTHARTADFLKQFGNEQLEGFEKLEDFVNSLEKPRRILLMVQAGKAVDEVLEQLYRLLEPGDFVIDCGNSYYEDTERRQQKSAELKINFLGMGISGGEEGALKGPSLMPGLTRENWDYFEKMLEIIAARDFQGGACVTAVGQGGAGHFVKMVHNGIEYAILQLIAEIYDFKRKINGAAAGEIAEIFTRAGKGPAASFLTEITAQVLGHIDGRTNRPLVDLILDKASQKGTGGWTAMEGFKFGAVTGTIGEAVAARTISSLKEVRVSLSKNGSIPTARNRGKSPVEPDWEKILLAGMVVAFTQGFSLIRQASEQRNWKVNPAELARIWQGGCIIRAVLLSKIQTAFQNNPDLNLLMADPEINDILKNSFPELQKFVIESAKAGLAVPVSAAAYNYLLAINDPESPANLIQGLRDFFGAHTFERTDQAGTFHENWQN